MSLRTRLVVTFTALLLVVIVGLGIVLVRSTRSVLTAQVDDLLRGIQVRIAAPVEGPPFQGFVGRGPEGFPEADIGPLSRGVAIVIADADGQILYANPSGFFDAPDPLPDVSSLVGLTNLEPDIRSITSVDGGLSYRAVVGPTFNGGIVVFAAPLGEVDAAVAGLLRTLVLSGAGVMLLGAAATWWTVRTSLKPVDQMVATATAIAAGDIGKRVPDADATTELGRLSGALNDMLTKIEDAFGVEQEAQERLKLFIADASHELRTPIAAVQGYAELYRRGALADSAALDKAIRRISTASARMERLVEDLLLLARLDRERPRHERTVNLAGVVRDAVTDTRAIDPDRPITIETPQLALVVGDEQQLGQVVTNLLSNARTHTPPGTSVRVELRGENGQVFLDVVDDGPGLPPEHLDHVFDRFYRIDTSRSRQSGGAGLGLAIVAAIVDAHGGTVRAANEAGHGARFTIELPAAG